MVYKWNQDCYEGVERDTRISVTGATDLYTKIAKYFDCKAKITGSGTDAALVSELCRSGCRREAGSQ